MPFIGFRWSPLISFLLFPNAVPIGEKLRKGVYKAIHLEENDQSRQ
ncbi:hypothetical protein ADIS_4327 [Lunatimonas lonarensis]|uniref:Uncharacterized protein n=1 Tax=Lunatimonas lonarensis TaxID=1232681 RepID=R7ZM30_9BACT|nr:hypothetical protein ADIS_4327 [Lunatimonas lonarensis]